MYLFFIYRIFINCPTDSDIKENSCYWDFKTTPMYRQPYEFYDFRLNGQNALGNVSTFINFHHYANSILKNIKNNILLYGESVMKRYLIFLF